MSKNLKQKDNKQENKKRVKHNIRTIIVQKNKDDQVEEIIPEIQLIPFGIYGDGEDKFILDKEASDLVMAAFKAIENDMVIDYEHQTLDGKEAPAAGWIKELVNKDKEGIWGKVEWTEKANRYIKKGEYKYISPVFVKRVDDNKVVELINAGLTNQPAIDGMEPIVNKDKKIIVNKDNLNTDEILNTIISTKEHLEGAFNEFGKLHDLLSNALKPDENNGNNEGNERGKDNENNNNNDNPTNIVNRNKGSKKISVNKLTEDLDRIERKIKSITRQ